ncbi:MAG: RNA polymerase sigma factor [Planctomycetes bacterium]|nr:RNA polymerase sigma factor [Planctomycetota bacterium]
MCSELPTKNEEWEAAAREFAPMRPVLHRFLMARVRDHHVAEDLTQETLWRGVVHAGQLRARGAALGWLLRIAWHVALDWHRRRVRRRQAWRVACGAAASGLDEAAACVAEPGDLERGEEAARSAECRRRLAELLARLRPIDQVLLLGYHFSGLSCRDLAVRTRLSRATVKQRLCRARRRLRPEADLRLLPARPARTDPARASA